MKFSLIKEINRYLTANGTLVDLEAWLMYNTQIFADYGERDAVALADKVEADLAAHEDGLIDEPTLRSRLASYVG